MPKLAAAPPQVSMPSTTPDFMPSSVSVQASGTGLMPSDSAKFWIMVELVIRSLRPFSPSG